MIFIPADLCPVCAFERRLRENPTEACVAMLLRGAVYCAGAGNPGDVGDLLHFDVCASHRDGFAAAMGTLLEKLQQERKGAGAHAPPS